MYQEIDLKDRINSYNYFKNFSNSTYGVSVKVDVTKVVKISKKNNQSFFINFLFILLKGLNSIDEMRIRLLDDKPVIFDDINPAFTVMTKLGAFVNVRFENKKDYKEFYNVAHEVIEKAKNITKIEDSYNPKNVVNEYYITCLPLIDFCDFSNPIPDDICSQVIPRISWGKFVEENGKFLMTLNITVSHMFVDGFPLSNAFLKIQEYLDNAENILK